MITQQVQKRLQRIPFSLVGCLALLTACTDENPFHSRFTAYEQGYPLKVGNTWEYDVGVSDGIAMYDEEIGADSSLVEFNAHQIWEVVAIDTVDGEAAFRIDITSRVIEGEEGRLFTYGQKGKESMNSKWLVVRGDTLVEVMNTVSQFDEGFSMKPLQSAASVVLVMPLKLGLSWAASRGSSPSRSVLTVEDVSVPAGQFQALRVRSANPLIQVWQEDHWYGEPGLIRYSLQTERQVRVEDERGNSVNQTLRTVVVGELLSFQLQ